MVSTKRRRKVQAKEDVDEKEKEKVDVSEKAEEKDLSVNVGDLARRETQNALNPGPADMPITGMDRSCTRRRCHTRRNT